MEHGRGRGREREGRTGDLHFHQAIQVQTGLCSRFYQP